MGAAYLLGRHVRRRPEHLTRPCSYPTFHGLIVVADRLAQRGAGETEVEDLDESTRRQKDVRRFDVTVNEPLPVERDESGSDLTDEPGRNRDCERAFEAESPGEGRAKEQLGREVGVALADRVGQVLGGAALTQTSSGATAPRS